MNSGSGFSNLATGIAVPLNGFGTSLGYDIPFDSVSASGEEIRLKEYRVTFSALLLSDHLSLGIGLAQSQLVLPDQTINRLRATVGGLYRFPKRIFIGASFAPGSTFGTDHTGRTFTLPDQAALGVSWIPNRVFRGSLCARWVAAESDVFSFHSPQQAVGLASASQLHLGLVYQFLEFKHFYTNLFAGSYLENSRSSDASRFHYTGGIEFQPWFLNLSLGADSAPGYRNFIFAVGADVGEILHIFNLYPKDVPPPSAGIFPRPFEVTDDWLPTQLQDHPEESFQRIDPELDDFRRVIAPKPGL